MVKRLIGAALLAVLLVPFALPVAVLAAEAGEGGEAVEQEALPPIEEIGTDTAREEGFFPEEYTSPSWFQWVLYPTIILGVVITLVLLFYYLAKQPEFAEERKKSSKR